MEDTWVNIDDDLPQIERGMQNVSVDVIVRTAHWGILPGFYDYRRGNWYDLYGHRIWRTVVAWRSLEEAPA